MTTQLPPTTIEGKKTRPSNTGPRIAKAAMIHTLEIENFRCFERLRIESLGRINVVVGNNAAGKTSLLEAIFLSQMQSPEIAFRFKFWRGLGGEVQIRATKSEYEGVWRDLFYRHDQRKVIDVKSSGSVESTRRVRIFYASDEQVQIQLPLSQNGSSITKDDAAAITPITFEVFDGNDKRHEFKPEIAPGGIRIRGAGLTSPAAFFASSYAAITPSEAAQQLSELSKSGKKGLLSKLVHSVFPNIKNLSAEFYGGVWMLHCNVSGIKPKVPVGFVSSGIHKLFLLLLGIASQRDGIVLIDEVENGFYYKALPKVWQALYTFAKKFRVQLFASTHSHECLLAIRSAISGHETDFRLIRVEETKQGKSARVFSGDSLESALETDTEIR